jgi:small-conductance mechanosensitive channel
VVIKDFENRRIVIPNSVISNETIVNSTITDEKVCMFVEFNISFESSIDKALTAMQETAAAHPLCVDNRTEEEKEKGDHKVLMRVIEITDYSVKLRAYAWANNPTEGFDLKCDLIKQIKERFDKEKIEIPYPHRTVIARDSIPAVD